MRARDHSVARTTLALLGTLPPSLLLGTAAARWWPGDGGVGLAVGWHLPYLAWPALALATLCAPSARSAAAWVGGATLLLAMLSAV